MNTNNLINVNIDTRQVVIPNNFTLGVENDNSCSKIGFLVPKKSDITDISDLTFKINTLSARGTADIIDCITEEQDDYFIITADLKGTIFECNGKAIINLCGCKYDDNNNIIKKWGTEDIVVSVGAHTDAEKAIEQLYPSVLEELKKKIDASKVTEEQLNTIAQKVAEKGFYTKSEVDSLINAKPTITVDTELNETSNNPVANSAVYKSFNTVNSNIQSMFKNVNDNINGLTDDLDDKADKTALPTKLSDLADDTEHRTVTDAEKAKWNSNTGGTGASVTVDTELNADSNNPVTNKAITNAINSKADKFTVDTVVSATSDNPVSSKAVSTSLNALSNEIGEGIEAQLAEKADKTDLDKKVNKSDVVTALTTDTVASENPISTKLFYEQISVLADKVYNNYGIICDNTPIGEDTNNLPIIDNSDGSLNPLDEVYFILYGRENNADDTLANANGSDNITINGTRVLVKPLLYIRKSGTYFYTIGHIKQINNFIVGTVTLCDGGGANHTMQIEPVNSVLIDTISIVSNNLIKSDSKLTVYYK